MYYIQLYFHTVFLKREHRDSGLDSLQLRRVKRIPTVGMSASCRTLSGWLPGEEAPDAVQRSQQAIRPRCPGNKAVPIGRMFPGSFQVHLQTQKLVPAKHGDFHHLKFTG